MISPFGHIRRQDQVETQYPLTSFRGKKEGKNKAQDNLPTKKRHTNPAAWLTSVSPPSAPKKRPLHQLPRFTPKTRATILLARCEGSSVLLPRTANATLTPQAHLRRCQRYRHPNQSRRGVRARSLSFWFPGPDFSHDLGRIIGCANS